MGDLFPERKRRRKEVTDRLEGGSVRQVYWSAVALQRGSARTLPHAIALCLFWLASDTMSSFMEPRRAAIEVTASTPPCPRFLGNRSGSGLVSNLRQQFSLLLEHASTSSPLPHAANRKGRLFLERLHFRPPLPAITRKWYR